MWVSRKLSFFLNFFKRQLILKQECIVYVSVKYMKRLAHMIGVAKRFIRKGTKSVIWYLKCYTVSLWNIQTMDFYSTIKRE